MTKAERIAALISSKETPFTEEDRATLEACTDAQLDTLEKQDRKGRIASLIAGSAPKVEETPAPKVETTDTPKVLTEAQALELMPESIRGVIQEGLRVGQAKKAATIKVLKDSGRNKFTDAELEAKSQSELDALVALVGTPTVDYSGQNAPRQANSGTQEVAAAPDLSASIRAARGQK